MHIMCGSVTAINTLPNTYYGQSHGSWILLLHPLGGSYTPDIGHARSMHSK